MTTRSFVVIGMTSSLHWLRLFAFHLCHDIFSPLARDISKTSLFSVFILINSSQKKRACSVIFICGIARVHMVVLASLSTGLLISISWFERAWNDVQRRRGGQAKSGNDAASLAQGNKEPEKTDWETKYYLADRICFHENVMPTLKVFDKTDGRRFKRNRKLSRGLLSTQQISTHSCLKDDIAKETTTLIRCAR